MFNPKALGGIQLAGGLLTVVLLFLNMGLYAAYLLALLFIILGVHHVTE